jgi:hypothetical protein
MDGSLSLESVMVSKVLPDLHGVVKVFNIEASREPLHLSFKFVLGVVESFVASAISEGINGLRLASSHTFVIKIEIGFSECLDFDCADIGQGRDDHE